MSETFPTTRRAALRSANRAGRKLYFQPETGPAGDVLLFIFLRGAMDGLHTVPSYAEPAYHRHRPTLGLPDPGKPDGIVDLDGFFGLHPGLKPLHELFAAKRLAIVHAVGSPDQTLSHFEAMQTMERGVSDGNSTATGWITRHLATFDHGGTTPVRALAIGDVLPKSMQGAISATAVRSLTDFRLKVPEEWGASYRSVLAEMYSSGHDPVCEAGQGTLKLLERLEKLDPNSYRPEGGAVYPETGFGRGVRQVAQLIKAEVGLEIAQVDLGGWDAHAAQVTLMTGLMDELGKGLHALHADLGDRMRRVTVVALSEFGRRVHENSTLGTDHGRASAMFLLGGGIRGGKVYSRWPGIDNDRLDRDGNLRVTTDYRDVLTEIVERRLGHPNAAQVFPDYTPEWLDVSVGPRV